MNPIGNAFFSSKVESRKLAQSHAAFDLLASVEHLERLTDILLMASSQALELRGIGKASDKSRAIGSGSGR
jgi:hypothetical protein